MEPPRSEPTIELRGVLHPVEGSRTGIVMVDGAGGGTRGPAGIYKPLAARLNEHGVTALRLDYRYPNRLAECVEDVLAALQALAVERSVLLGWSFGGAVVITAGAISDRVVGVATVASQTYGTAAARELSPKALLLLHGTADPVLPHFCSEDIYRRAGEPKQLILYPGDAHGLEHHADAVLETLLAWARNLLG